jgi:alkanesulfonate monooxygenase SsuD/methylene tetrahydromethanopterin reductase-like flavin-dependent oxidoreductase (luciferase family)
MLDEAVGLIHALWAGEQIRHERGHFTRRRARLD